MSDSKIEPGKLAELKKLDRDRSYGSVHPAIGDAHFHQDGLYYNHFGKLVTENPVDPETGKTIELFGETAQKKLKKLAALAIANEAKRKALADAGFADDGEEAAEDGPAAAEKFDFVGWLKGARKVQWFVVKQAIKDEYGRNVQNQKEAIAFLVVDEGLVEPDDVKIG